MLNFGNKHKGEFIIVKIIGDTQIPFIIDTSLDFYNDFEEADFDRMYYQTNRTELLKVIKF